MDKRKVNRFFENFLRSPVSIKQKIVKKFPKFYQEVLKRWGKISSSPKVLSAVASQFVWYNEYRKIDNNTIYCRYFSQKNLNHIGDLFGNNGKMRSWEDLRTKLDLDDKKKFYRRQIIHIFECSNNICNLTINEHHLIKKHQIYRLEKLNSRELYNINLYLK